jgi:hypothetical protein
MGAPRRHKTPDELTTDELLAVEQAQARGEPAPIFETEKYRTARVKALRDAGLEDEADELEDADDDDAPDLDAMTTDELAAHLRATGS